MIAPPRGSLAPTTQLNSGVVAFTAFCLALSAPVFAQSFQGGIRGSVRDATGVVRDAEVRLVEDGLNVSTTVELPYGSGRRWLTGRGLLETLAGGWMIPAVAGYQSGFPITLRQTPNNADLLGNGQRPNVVEGVNPRLSNDYDPSCRCIRWLNPTAWSQAAPFTFGNAPRADGRVRTPALRNFDVAIEKSHRVSRTTVAVRAELINVLNLTNLRGPSIAFGDPSFGQIREAAGFPRLLQLSARASW